MPYFRRVSRHALLITLVVALCFGVAFSFLWYLSFGVGDPGYGDVEFELVDAGAEVSYHKDGRLSISASSELDAYRALGFVTAREHAWTMSLLRQTATGRLSEWFGSPVFELDSFARRLGFEASARRAFADLGPEDEEALEAYSSGIAAALEQEAISLADEFVLLGVKPTEWRPWHSLAIEQMLAWLAEPPIRPEPGDTAYWPVKDLEADDLRFRCWLHLHGGQYSAAWAWPDSAGTRFTARFVSGASALPSFAAVDLDWPGVSVSGINMIGTPIFPAVSGKAGARVVLPSSRREVLPTTIQPDSTYPKRHERIVDRSGDERLVWATLIDGKTLLGPLDPYSARQSDSTVVVALLQWSGLHGISDWPAFRSDLHRVAGAAGHAAGDYRLLDGSGLALAKTAPR